MLTISEINNLAKSLKATHPSSYLDAGMNRQAAPLPLTVSKIYPPKGGEDRLMSAFVAIGLNYA